MTEAVVTKWLSPKGAADRLGLTPQRVVQLARAGRLSCVKTRLGRLIDPADVERLATERQRADQGAAQ